MQHPWGILRDVLPDWDVKFAELGEHVRGVTDIPAQTIWLDSRLNQAERRSTLTHELIHVFRGDHSCSDWTELQVEKGAARWLISIQRLGDAIVWAANTWELADELWVDEPLIKTRLAHLHPAERAYLAQRMAAKPAGAS